MSKVTYHQVSGPLAKYLVPTRVAILFVVFGSFSVAFAQLAADLSAAAPAGDLSVNSVSADLSVHDGPENLSAGGGGGRSRGLIVGVLPARTGGPSSLGGGVESASAGQGSFVTLRSAALSSRASLLNKHQKTLQEASSTSFLTKAKPALRSRASTNLFVSPISSTESSTLSAPQSFQSRSSGAEAPLYSFIVRHEKGGSRSVESRQALSSNPGHMKKSRNALIQSLRGVGSGHGSSR